MAWFIDLPAPTEGAILGIVLAVLTLAIQFLASYVPWLAAFLEQYKQEWAIALTGALVLALEAWLPGGDWADVSILGVQIVVAVLVIALGRIALNKLRVRGFMQ
jgi:hypothetical protein